MPATGAAELAHGKASATHAYNQSVMHAEGFRWQHPSKLSRFFLSARNRSSAPSNACLGASVGLRTACMPIPWPIFWGGWHHHEPRQA